MFERGDLIPAVDQHRPEASIAVGPSVRHFPTLPAIDYVERAKGVEKLGRGWSPARVRSTLAWMPGDISRVGGPNPNAADGQLALAQLRRAMFASEAPVRLDRYRLLRRIGRGAQGTVFEAEDVELGRRLAVKVLAVPEGVDAAARTTRMLREARAMASVSHPHVVQVYAAGRSGNEVWIAMELVLGTTLEDWMEGRVRGSPDDERTARQILQRAGEGLAAAHALGFVHRDFKPANVLLGEDGSVKLTDFGLARPFDWLGAARPDGDGLGRPTDPDLCADGFESTEDSTVVGTPRYMSPEQLRGESAGIASDQFNFAVTAWEVLFGEHPFAHRDLVSLEAAISAQNLYPPRGHAVPRGLVKALVVALRTDPQRRHSSLGPLVRALDPTPRSRAAAIGLAMAGACAGALLVWGPSSEPRVACRSEDAVARFEAARHGENATEVSNAISKTGIPDAGRVAVQLDKKLDDYGRRWSAGRLQVCEAGWGTSPQAQQRFDARTACLDQALATVEALTARLANPDAALATHAVTAAAGLPDPRQCLGEEVTWERETPASEALRDRVAIASADLLSGRYREAAEAGTEVGLEAGRASLPRIRSAALEIAGKAYGELSEPKRFTAYTDAYYAAVEVDDVSSMARLGGELARQHAYADHLDEARWWFRHATGALRPASGWEVRLGLRHAEALIAFREGDVERCEGLMLDVLDELERRGEQSSELAWLVGLWLSGRYGWHGRPEDGSALAESLRVAMTRELGSGHPRLSRVAMAQSTNAAARGHNDAALGYAQEAIGLSELAYGSVNPRTAAGHAWVGGVLQQEQRFDEADLSYRAAIAAAGEAPTRIKARVLATWSKLRWMQYDPRTALSLMEQAVAVGNEVFPVDSPELRRLHESLALARREAPAADKD